MQKDSNDSSIIISCRSVSVHQLLHWLINCFASWAHILYKSAIRRANNNPDQVSVTTIKPLHRKTLKTAPQQASLLQLMFENLSVAVPASTQRMKAKWQRIREEYKV